jgi:hypothetical protein
MKLKDFMNKENTAVFAILIQSGLINYKHYYCWCDEVIDKEERPPLWVIDLSITSMPESAAGIVNDYAYSEPFEEFDEKNLSNIYLACLLLRYITEEISWSSFLLSAGNYCDGIGYSYTKFHCEYFYSKYNDFEENSCEEKIKNEQLTKVKKELADEMAEIQGYYNFFNKYRREYSIRYKE